MELEQTRDAYIGVLTTQVKDLLVANTPPTRDGIAAMLAHPLDAAAIHASLLTLRHSTNQTVEQIRAPLLNKIEKLEKRIEELLFPPNQN